ncbi:hypothetical protein HBH64_037160 [Parastagonospora nodorum]|nr:hypothetical protein HBH50_168430 [Parastagonospora nodorum]KAH4089206.1 hypothetical protein HBH48_110160 [Parastagonospora nodorum]KAH4308156.1 hypothetical protein HBI01_041640 [Parastagonospora nodorum]KAH4313868.1 hypothetical protein HBI02_069120 [Parastagonospora nodorum]KAH4333752.1 hypothetical protein HBI00_039810 [Parastagonospora nodorum]
MAAANLRQQNNRRWLKRRRPEQAPAGDETLECDQAEPHIIRDTTEDELPTPKKRKDDIYKQRRPESSKNAEPADPDTSTPRTNTLQLIPELRNQVYNILLDDITGVTESDPIADSGNRIYIQRPQIWTSRYLPRDPGNTHRPAGNPASYLTVSKLWYKEMIMLVWNRSWIHFRGVHILKDWLRAEEEKRIKGTQLVMLEAYHGTELRNWKPGQLNCLRELPNLKAFCVHEPYLSVDEEANIRNVFASAHLPQTELIIHRAWE